MSIQASTETTEAIPVTPSDLADPEAAAKRRNRYEIAVSNFIDLYKFIMVLAIGNCVRCLAERQIQSNPGKPNGLELKLESISIVDGFMFVLALMFISRFFLGDMAYWKSYCERNKQIQVTDALNLLINSCFLTYMSFFIGYSHAISYMMLFLLFTEVIWGLLRRIEGYFRTTDGPLSREIEAGLILSLVTVVIVALLISVGELPARLPDGASFTQKQNWIVISILLINNIADLLINGGRYLGATDSPWLLSVRRPGG